MRRLVVTAGLVFALGLSGCGSDETKSGAGTSTSSSTSSTSTSTSSTTAPCQFVGTTDPQENALAPVDQLLSDVNTATDGCVDSITFGFRPSAAPAPSYRVDTADGPFTNSAGEAVTPEGSAFLKVRFQPAWIADLGMESAPLTYSGPRVLTPVGMKAVRGVAMFDASEAVVGWIIGLDAKHPFAVDATAGKVVVQIG